MKDQEEKRKKQQAKKAKQEEKERQKREKAEEKELKKKQSRFEKYHGRITDAVKVKCNGCFKCTRDSFISLDYACMHNGISKQCC